MEVYFARSGATLSIPKDRHVRVSANLRWLGAQPDVELAAQGKLASHTNYLIGADPRYWRTHVDNYARLRYRSLYPGIDLVFYGSTRDLEHDFVISPGADARQIAFTIDGARGLAVNPAGDLTVDLGGPTLVFKRPVAYQGTPEQRRTVAASFVQTKNRIGFKLGPYDHTQPLIIDPVLSFATYLDGTQNDAINAVTTDAAGNVFLAGQTTSSDFPRVNEPPAFCPNCSANQTANQTHAFVSKLDPTGHTLLYSTFIGGSSGETGDAIAIDFNGNIIVTGGSNSSDFPHAGSFPTQAPQINGTSFFMASLTPDGSAFNYAGLLGSGVFVNGEVGVLAVDGQGNAYLAGVTESSNFPITPGTLAPSVTGFPFDSMFISKVAPSGALVYSTIVPGTATPDPAHPNVNQFIPFGIAVDANGNAIVAGNAGPGLPTTPNVVGVNFPLPTNIEAVTAGFVLKLNSTASAIGFASYVPGADNIHALAVDGLGNLFVTGQTSETNLAVSANAFQKTVQPGQNCTCSFGYVAELDSQAQSFVNASYLTGTTAFSNIGTIYTHIALDSHSNILVSGSTASSDVPMQNPLVSQFTTFFSSTPTEGYIAELKSDFTSLLFGSFLSGTDAANFTALTIDSGDHAILTGTTFGSDFPTTPNSFQPVPPPPPPGPPFGSFPHTFVAKMDLGAAAPSACFNPSSVAFGGVLVGTSATQALNVTNCGNAPLTINTVTSSVATITASQSCAAVAPGNTCGVQVTFSPIDSSISNGTLTITDNTAIGRQSIAVSGKGGVPQVFFPPSIQLNDQIVGTQAKFFLFVDNQGDGNYIVSNMTVTGDFAVDNQCTAPLPPVNTSFAFCVIGLTFAPTQSGLRTGILTITDNAPGSPHVIALSGHGLSTYPTPGIQTIVAVPTDATSPALRVIGTNFFPASQVLVNGTPRTTHYLSQGELFADLLPGDVAGVGELPVTVSNPSPGGGSSNTFTATVYAAIRKIQILHSVFDPNSGLLYSSVSSASPTFAGQIVVIDPAAAKVTNNFSVGNGPNQLAVSGDGQLLYVGVDGDKTVAQVSLPAGTVNFAASLGTDPLFHNPMVADAIRVLPGQPHSWAATLCGTGFTPCGEGIAVFDDAVKRSTAVSQNQLQPDSLLFIGNDASTLYGTTLNQGPSTFYQFAINSSGITLTKAITNFSSESPGGGTLDTDGSLIYVSNGQVIDPSTLAIKSHIPQEIGSSAFSVDGAASRVYFAGRDVSFGFFSFDLNAFDIVSQQLVGSIPIVETAPAGVFRWGTNGLALTSSAGALVLRSSLTGPVPPAQFSVSGLAPATAVEGNGDLAVTISGSGFASGDVVASGGVVLQSTVVSASTITATVPAALLTSAGDIQITITAPGNHTANLVLIIAPAQGPVAVLSASTLSFGPQSIGATAAAQNVTVSNNGTAALVFSGIAASGDFAQTNNCSSVAPGSSCSISVVFKPTAAGTRSGVLTINDNAASNPQSVALTGGGAAIQIGGTTTATITAGQTASYNLSISPQGGLTGQVTFSCANLPQHASCSINPPGANLAGAAVNVTVSIATAQQTASLLAVPPQTVFAFLGLPALLLSYWRLRHKPGLRVRVVAFALVLVSVLAIGCGGGGGGTGGPSTQLTPAGTYTINFTATGSGTSQTTTLTLVVQ